MTMRTDERNRQIEVMVGRYCKGKMPPDGDWAAFHSAFQHTQTTARGLAIEVYRGWAFCPVYDGRRRKENFKEAWHIALDFDTQDERSSLPYLAERDLVNWFASFGYTTPSHTPEAPKARIVWIFEEPITDIDEYEDLYKALLWKFPWADSSAKDAVRLFYGSPGCEVWDNWSAFGKGARDWLVREWRTAQPPPDPEPIKVVANHEQLPPKFLQVAANKLIDNVLSAPDGEKHDTLNRIAYTFGGYVAGGYYTVPQVEGWLQQAVRKMHNVQSVQAAYDTITTALRDGQSTPLYFEVAQAPRPGDTA